MPKITQLIEVTSISGSALLLVVDDPGSTTASKKITKTNLFLGTATGESTPQVGSLLYLYNNCI